MGSGEVGGRKAKSEEDEGDLEVTIISRDGLISSLWSVALGQ